MISKQILKKVYKKAIHLLNIIYIENTNLILSTIDYRTIYETIFNYDKIEKKEINLEKINQKKKKQEMPQKKT